MLGKFEPSIKYNGQTVAMPILMVKGDIPNLLGRDILGTITLDWANLFHVQHATLSTKLVEEFPDVFSDGLGTLKGETICGRKRCATVSQSSTCTVNHVGANRG